MGPASPAEPGSFTIGDDETQAPKSETKAKGKAEKEAAPIDPNAVETVTLKKGDEKIVVNKGSDKAAELKQLGYK